MLVAARPDGQGALACSESACGKPGRRQTVDAVHHPCRRAVIPARWHGLALLSRMVLVHRTASDQSTWLKASLVGETLGEGSSA